MPVTLYIEQWERLLEIADEIRNFLKEHDGELKRKQRSGDGGCRCAAAADSAFSRPPVSRLPG